MQKLKDRPELNYSNNIEAERVVLGSLLLDNSTIDTALEIIQADYFFSVSHQILFNKIIELYRKGIPVDIITLYNAIVEDGNSDKVGGAEYISSLPSSVPTAENIEFYADIVKGKALGRKLLTIQETIKTQIIDGFDSCETIENAEKLLYSLSDEQNRIQDKDLASLLGNVYQEAMKRKLGQCASAYLTGFNRVDELTNGFEGGDLIIIAGRPGMGKTSFALRLAENFGIVKKIPVVIFSLEMSAEQLAHQLICSHKRLDAEAIRSGIVSEQTLCEYFALIGQMAENPIKIIDEPYLTPLKIRAKLRKLKREQNIQIAIIDYLQLLAPDDKFEIREREVAAISREMKLLAKELNIPIVIVAQLNRAAEKRVSNRPVLSDLRESGAIEQDADIVMLLYREYYYTQDVKAKGKAELILAKQRRGPTGTIKLTFLEEYRRFENQQTYF